MPRFRPTAVLALCLLLLAAGQVAAHPMGNFSINRYSALTVEPDGLRLRYRIDFAEIPSLQEFQASKTSASALASPEAKRAYMASHVGGWVGQLRLTVDGQPIPFEILSSDVAIRPGAADLPTLLITIDARAPLAASASTRKAEYADDNYAGRAGWREIVVRAGPGCSVPQSTAPSEDASHELTAYPPADLQPPPQDDRASFTITIMRVAAAAPALPPPQPPTPATTAARRPGDAFGALIAAEHVSWRVAILSLVAAFTLGTFHALAPGHGKTVVAAYLVGSRGTARHAVILGIIVTLTHTAAVFMLGLLVLFASRYVLPEKVYPWLGFFSGMMILSIGAWQLVRRWSAAARTPIDDHGHSHALPENITFRSLFALGVSGGIVPCPSALVVLLSAVALHRVGFGLVLIVAFSIGLATVLIVIGWLILYARSLIGRIDSMGGLLRRAPIVSSIAIAAIGLFIAIQSLWAGGLL